MIFTAQIIPVLTIGLLLESQWIMLYLQEFCTYNDSINKKRNNYR